VGVNSCIEESGGTLLNQCVIQWGNMGEPRFQLLNASLDIKGESEAKTSAKRGQIYLSCW